jgi:hypothetical protein
MQTAANIKIQGFVKITDLSTGEILRNVENAVNPESLSLIIAKMLQGNNSQYLYELHLGNGGIVIDETGNITYKDVEENLSLGPVAELYNPLYYKVIDTIDEENNIYPTRNNVVINHLNGLPYTDIVITCTLEEEEPDWPSPPDNDGEIIFNELGIKSRGLDGKNTGLLLTQVVFEPVVKNLNRVIQIEYTLRIRV